MTEKEQSFAISIRFKHRNESSAKNDLRHDLRRGPQPKYIDGDRSGLNSVIIQPESPSILRKLCSERRELLDKQRKEKAAPSVASSFIITFGTGLQEHMNELSHDEQNALYEAVAVAATERLGIELTGLVAHRDETAPHAHGQCPARHPEGDPVSKVITPAIASELQDIAMEAARPFLPMIVRGKKKADRIAEGEDASAIYNRSVKQLHEDLPKEISAAEAALAIAQERVDEMQRYLAQTEAKLEAGKGDEVKLAKRLATYEKRLADRNAELTAAEDKLRDTEAKAKEIEQREVSVEAKEKQSERSMIAQDKFDEYLDKRDTEISEKLRAIEEREKQLSRVLSTVSRLVGSVADMLGVGSTLREIRDTIRNAGIEFEDPFLATPEDAPQDPDDGLPGLG